MDDSEVSRFLIYQSPACFTNLDLDDSEVVELLNKKKATEEQCAQAEAVSFQPQNGFISH